MLELTTERLFDFANIAETFAHRIQGGDDPKSVLADKDEYLHGWAPTGVPNAEPELFERAVNAFRNFDPAEAANPHLVDLLSRVCLGIRTLNPELVETANAALQDTELSAFLPPDFVSAYRSWQAPRTDDEPDHHVIDGRNFDRLADNDTLIAQPFAELRELRYFLARGLVSETVRSLLHIDPCPEDYQGLIRDAERVLGYSIDQRIIQDRLVFDALDQARHELGPSVPDDRRTGEGIENLVVHVMLDRLVPHDDDGWRRPRDRVVFDHVGILNALNTIYAENIFGIHKTNTLVDAMLWQTSCSYIRDDRFLGGTFGRAIQAMKGVSWSSKELIMMLHLLRGLEPAPGEPRDEAPLRLLETLAQGGSEFDDAFAHLAQAYGPKLSYPHWPAS